MQRGYLRRIEVLIGPLPEWKGGDESRAIKIVSDGTQKTLRIRFSVYKHIAQATIPTTVTITNLSEEMRNVIQNTNDVQIILRVGWENSDIVQMFQGAAVTVISQRSGADIETVISAFGSFTGSAGTVLSQTFNAGSRLADVVAAIASEFTKRAGTVVDPANIDVDNFVFGSAGWSFAGVGADALNQLSRVYGFTWKIEGGKFFAIDDNRSIGSPIKISTENGFLLRAEPMLVTAPGDPFGNSGTSKALKKGMIIKSILHPLVEGGSTVTLKSSVTDSYNGDYKVTAVNHIGDSHSQQWYSDIQSFNFEHGVS